MKRMVVVLSAVMCLLFFFSPFVEAVTFTSSGGSAAPVKESGKTKVPSQQKATQGTVALLDLPKSQKARLADSIELVRLTGIQASLAFKNLAELDNRGASVGEMKARLNHAAEACDVLEKAGKRLEDAVKIVRIALENPENTEEFIAAAEEVFQVSPSLWTMFGASPAMAFVTPDEMMGYQMREIGKQLDKEFGALMDRLSSAAQTVQNAASSVGRGMKNAVGWVTDKVAAGHHKIGSVVGQKNWASTMAGTKFVAAISVAGIGLVVVVSAPAVSTAGAVTAVVAYTAANVGACVTFANELSQIQESKGSDELGKAATRLTQTASLIGVAGGSPQDIALATLGVTGDEIANAGGSRVLSVEELSEYLSEPERKALLDALNALREYQSSDADDQEDSEGGNGGGGGSGGGCGCM